MTATLNPTSLNPIANPAATDALTQDSVTSTAAVAAASTEHVPARAAVEVPTRRRPRRVALGYVVRELRRPFRKQYLIFNTALPAVLYLSLFKTGPSHATIPHGNFAAWMMFGIAVYGAASSATSTAAAVSIEKASGWMRTIRMAPISTINYVLVKVLAAMLGATIPVIIVGILGHFSHVEASTRAWVFGLLAAWLGSAVFAAFGLGIGLAVRPEVITSIPALIVTALAFLGDLFIPLTGTMRTVGQYSPMYGIASLSRHVLTDGYSFSGTHTSIRFALINTGVWFLVFVFWAAMRFRRSSGRN